MVSFFDKLRKGMNLEADSDSSAGKKASLQKKQKSALKNDDLSRQPKETKKKPNAKKEPVLVAKKEKRIKKGGEQFAQNEEIVLAADAVVPEVDVETETQTESETEEKEVAKEIPVKENNSPIIKEKEGDVKAGKQDIIQTKEDWPEAEGELVVDVYQTESELIVQSAVAGIKPEELDIDIEKDVLIIKGARKNNDCEKKDYFFQECYWGSFSRQIILPVEVDSSRVKAEMREGVLTIRMPKIIKEGKRKINVQAI